ncbi:MAG: c-type cytochrome [Methylococcaceae bacterium]|nr:c-type cytochrome [Methylococcaceae bacterium]
MLSIRSIACSLIAVLAVPVMADPPPVAPGYRELGFAAPRPGSYRLSDLGPAADGQVTEQGQAPQTLHQLLNDKLVILSLVYASCSDVNGCPLATSVLHRLAKRIKNFPQLRERVRLITLSFDPVHDTPERMAQYGQGFQASGVDWHFVSVPSAEAVREIAAGYQQDITPELDAGGKETGQIAHLLRVFLIDDRRRIRNSYTVSVLHADLLLADLQTLAQTPEPASAGTAPAPGDLLRGGDDKSGYQSADYSTRSVAVTARQGRAADLAAVARRASLGLPTLPIPKDNPPTRAKIELGRKLFYDRRLSLNNTFSCAMCHVPEQGFASNEQATSVGIEGRSVRRNAPTLYNVAYLEKLFHDGRESTLENQVWGPFLAANEMGNPSVGAVVDKVRRLPDYRGRFEAAFRRPAAMETVGQAIASYERMLIAADSPFDRWRYGHQEHALSAEAKRGFDLFTGKAGCAACHRVEERSALFTDNGLHNTGIGYRDSMAKTQSTQPVQLAPGISVNLDSAAIASVGQAKAADLGAYEITQDPADRWKYRTPSLRNIALTAPYMHNGSLATLREVIEFYNRGGEANENLDTLIRPLGLNGEEIADLEAFLRSLTGSSIAELVSDAYSAPIGDPR